MSFHFDKLRRMGQVLLQSWNRFFFTPQPPTAIGVYRILYGLLIVADLAMLHGDWLTWYGVNGFVRIETLRKMSPHGSRLFFDFIPQSDTWIQAFFWVFLLFAIFLTIGFFSRFSSIMVFLCFNSILHRDGFIIHSGDALLRATGFFLMFAPTGAALSIDRLWRIWRGKEGTEVQPRSPWAQRMIQIQLALVYISTFSWKMLGSDWRSGKALYYTTRLVQFQRFPMPALENGFLLRLATWLTLLVEFSAGVLVWIRKLRYWVLLAGLCLHLAIEYSMNIVLFEWITLAGYVTFIDSRDLSRAWTWVCRHFDGWLGDSVEVIFDRASGRSIRLVSLLQALDIFGRLKFIDRNSAEGRSAWPNFSERQAKTNLLIAQEGSMQEGFRALLAVSRVIPLLWWLVPVSLVSGPWKQTLPALKAAK